MIENVVIGKPLVPPEQMFASSKEDWEQVERPKTAFTTSRYLPAIMKEVGLVKSISEVRRNRPELNVCLRDYDFLRIKWGKKFLFVLVGQTDE